MSVSNAKLESMVAELLKEREGIADAKAILKGYKIDSDHLRELTRALRDLRDQVKAEKERIEEELGEDEDFVNAKEDLLQHKERAKELSAQLRELFATVTKDDLAKFEYKINGESQEVHVERVVKLYVNGKEDK